MTAWLDTEIRGDAAGCRGTAAELRRLAGALQLAGALADRHAQLSTAELDGRAGEAFRHHAERLSEQCAVSRERTDALARGLGALAAQLETCLDAMGAARGRARRGLVVTDTTIQPPALGRTDPVAAETWAAAVAAVDVVRRHEAAAQAAWRAVLVRCSAAAPSGPAAAPVAGQPHPSGHHPVPAAGGAPLPSAPAAATPAPTGHGHQHHHRHDQLAMDSHPLGPPPSVDIELSVVPLGSPWTDVVTDGGPSHDQPMADPPDYPVWLDVPA